MAVCKQGPWPWWHLGLGLPSLQNFEKCVIIVKAPQCMVFWSYGGGAHHVHENKSWGWAGMVGFREDASGETCG